MWDCCTQMCAHVCTHVQMCARVCTCVFMCVCGVGHGAGADVRGWVGAVRMLACARLGATAMCVCSDGSCPWLGPVRVLGWGLVRCACARMGPALG